MELGPINISGPRLLKPEEVAAREAAQAKEEDEKRKKKEQQRTDAGPKLAPLPAGPGAPGNRDNYYGNGMGLKRSNTLNYMYESRV